MKLEAFTQKKDVIRKDLEAAVSKLQDSYKLKGPVVKEEVTKSQPRDVTEGTASDEESVYTDEGEETEGETDDDYEEEEDEDDGERQSDEEEGNLSDEELSKSDMVEQYIAQQEYAGEEEGDLSFSKDEVLYITHKREDGWFIGKNSRGQEGMIPSNYLKASQGPATTDRESDTEEYTATTRKGSKHLWSEIRGALKETNMTRVLQAMGAVPSGFRDSTLAVLAQQQQYMVGSFVRPRLSPSCISYDDLFLDGVTNKVKSKPTSIQRIIILEGCKQIPLPGAGLIVKSRHVRVCLCEGNKVLSNIHTVCVNTTDRELLNWNFLTKATPDMKSIEFGALFVRANMMGENIGLLFEICLTYVRESTGESGEFSCGWAFLPLFEQNGLPAANKRYDLLIKGGSPWESNANPAAALEKSDTTSRLKALILRSKQPRLVVELKIPLQYQRVLLETLPDMLISNTCYIQYISLYRQLLANALLRFIADTQSSELIQNPTIVLFPWILEQPDLMDVLRAKWPERIKLARRADRENQEYLTDLCTKLIMENHYPLDKLSDMPAYHMTDSEVDKQRQQQIHQLQQLQAEKASPVVALLSPNIHYRPFDMAHLSYSIMTQM